MSILTCCSNPVVAQNNSLTDKNCEKEISEKRRKQKIETEKEKSKEKTKGNKNKKENKENKKEKEKKKIERKKTENKKKEKENSRGNSRKPSKTSESLKFQNKKDKEQNKNKNKENFKTHASQATTLEPTTNITKTSSIVKNQTMAGTSSKQGKIELVDGQWKASNYVNSNEVRLNKVQITDTVSIFNCENSTLIIEADKFKSMQIQNCQKCNVVLKNLISAIEIIDSKKIKVQITGRCSSITIDKCIGVNIYLSKQNEETEFTTALSAEMNVHIEGNKPEDDWKEITIPEQYQHVLDKGDLTTRVSDLYKF